jgi:hypothetical protein
MRFSVMFSTPALLALPVVAQNGSPIEFELDAESVTVVTPISDDDGLIEAEPFLGELSLTGTAEKVLENGVRIRGRFAARLQADHPNRPGGAGGFGTDAAAGAGASSGLSSAIPSDDSDLRARLETAYLQVDGGYGEVRLGKDSGVAARFHEGAPSVLSHARLDSALLDPSGLGTIRSRHDLTGPSAKISYATPRILGLRAGASFTPSADADGLDRRPSAGTGGFAPDIENALELALNGTRRFRESGLRVDAALAWSTADVSDQAAILPYDTVETWSAGTKIEQGDWTFGASWLSSDNGLPDADYTAWSAGLMREAWDAEFSLEYGQAEDDNANIDSSGWRFGVAKDFSKNTKIGVAYLHDEVETLNNHWESDGIVVEITLSAEILNITGN